MHGLAPTEPESDSYRSSARPIIVGGAARSGTTLLSVMLNSHPELVCGPESDVFRLWPEFKRLSVNPVTWMWHVLRGWTEPFRTLSRDFGVSRRRLRRLWARSGAPSEFIELFFAEYARRHGVTRWADKTPANVKVIGFIFEHFPQAKFVHLIRDGRDTCCSMLDWSRRYHKDRPWDIRAAADIWSRWIGLGREWTGHPNYTELRYEDLATEPEAALRPLFEFLELPWHAEVLDHHHQTQANRPDLALTHLAGVSRPVYRSSIGRWREQLTLADRRAVEEIAGPTLRELGYTESSDWVEQTAEQLEQVLS